MHDGDLLRAGHTPVSSVRLHLAGLDVVSQHRGEDLVKDMPP